MMSHGYYIVASRQHGAYQLPLLGPFTRMRAALAMWEPVALAVKRMRPDLADCDIKPAPISVRGRLPKGALDLDQAVDEEWVRYVTSGR